MKKPTSELVFLHGFLGFPSDWDEIRDALQVPSRAPSLTEPLTVEIPSILVGYSMGGRAAMHLAHKYPDLIKRVILLSSNIGDDNKESRHLLEQFWLQKWTEIGTEPFLRWWYSQPLFHTLNLEDMLSKRLSNTLKKATRETELWSLANSPNYWKIPYPCPVDFLYGEQDQKYRNILKHIGIPVPGAGHALHLENPAFLVKYLKNML